MLNFGGVKEQVCKISTPSGCLLGNVAKEIHRHWIFNLHPLHDAGRHVSQGHNWDLCSGTCRFSAFRCFLRSRYLIYIYIYLFILLYITQKNTESLLSKHDIFTSTVVVFRTKIWFFSQPICSWAPEDLAMWSKSCRKNIISNIISFGGNEGMLASRNTWPS